MELPDLDTVIAAGALGESSSLDKSEQLNLDFTPPPQSDMEESSPPLADTASPDTLSIGSVSGSDIPKPSGDGDALPVADSDPVAPSDGIEILVRMAKQKEIDPKAVDIIDVTDKFLKLIAAAPKENLRQSGKILFHACVLLRMKAEALLIFSVDEDPEHFAGDDFMDFEDGEGSIDFDSDNPAPRQITFADLERAIVRRSQRRKPKRRQVTLDELILALKEAEELERSRAERKPKARIELAGQHDVEGVDDLLDLAHDEDIERTIEQVELLLAQILNAGENIELFALVGRLDNHNDWVDAFLASLFLSNAGKIDLAQNEFYGPLFLSLCDGAAELILDKEVEITTESEAVQVMIPGLVTEAISLGRPRPRKRDRKSS